MQNSEIAVIIPCHDSERFLGRTASALLHQDFGLPYRLIFVNDASSDKTADILKFIKSYDPDKVTIIDSSAHNLPQARNAAMDLALESRFVCFSDADDVPHPDFLSSLYSLINGSGADCACRGYRIIDENTGKVNRAKILDLAQPLSGFRAAFEILRDGPVKAFVWSKIFSSSLLRRTRIRFLPERFVYEDLAFCFQTFLASDKVVFSDLPVYDYYIHKGSLSHTPNADGFMMHLCAYAACRAYSSFLIGEKKSLDMFRRMRMNMIYKTDCDILTARSLYPAGIRQPMSLARQLIKRICNPGFKVVGEPWEQYIIDLGVLSHPMLESFSNPASN